MKNAAQREEWVKLFAVDEVEGNLTTPDCSEEFKAEFLKAHPTTGGGYAALR